MFASRGHSEIQRGNLFRATQSYEKALQFNPYSPNMCLVAGRLNEKSGNMVRAYELYSKGCGIAPYNVDLLDSRGAAAIKLGKFEEAINSYDRLVAVGKPLAPHQIGNRAVALSSVGKYEEALLDYCVLNKIDPKDKAGYTGIAYCMVQLERYPEAIEKLSAIIAQSPKDFDSRLLRGWCYLRQKKDAQAIAEFNQVIAMDPENARAHQYLADFYFASGKKELALAELDKVIELDETSKPAFLSRGKLLLGRKEYQDALTDLVSASELGVLDFDSQMNLAEAALGAGRNDLAEKALTQYIEAKPELLRPYLLRARARAGQRDYRGAIEDCTHVIAKDPKNYPVILERASYHVKAGNNLSAKTDFETYTKLNPARLDGFVQMGKHQLAIGQRASALATFKRALQIDGNSVAARLGYQTAYESLRPASRVVVESKESRMRRLGYDELMATGFDALRRGEGKEAEMAFTLAVKRDPNSAMARRNLANILMSQGQSGAAQRQLEALKALGDVKKEDTVHLAKSFLRGGSPDKAAALLSRHLEKERSDVDATIALCESYLSLGKPSYAIELCLKAMTTHKNSPDYGKLERYYNSMKDSLDRRSTTKPVKRKRDQQRIPSTLDMQG